MRFDSLYLIGLRLFWSLYICFIYWVWRGWSFHVSWFPPFAGRYVAYKILVEICYFIIDEEYTELKQDCISMLEVVSICLISEVIILVSLFAELFVILFCELWRVTVFFWWLYFGRIIFGVFGIYFRWFIGSINDYIASRMEML